MQSIFYGMDDDVSDIAITYQLGFSGKINMCYSSKANAKYGYLPSGTIFIIIPDTLF